MLSVSLFLIHKLWRPTLDKGTAALKEMFIVFLAPSWQILVHYNCYSANPYGCGAVKLLARPTSQCRRTESIVSLERGVS